MKKLLIYTQLLLFLFSCKGNEASLYTIQGSGIAEGSVYLWSTDESYKELSSTTSDGNFSLSIPLDDALTYGCLPYYLAAQLLSSENDALASWFMTRYRETLADMKTKVPASFEPITTPYGLF